MYGAIILILTHTHFEKFTSTFTYIYNKSLNEFIHFFKVAKKVQKLDKQILIFSYIPIF